MRNIYARGIICTCNFSYTKEINYFYISYTYIEEKNSNTAKKEEFYKYINKV